MRNYIHHIVNFKNNRTYSPWIYLIATLIIYTMLCIFLGHREWILSVYFQNFASDISGETPRMLAMEYFDKLVYEATLTVNDRESISMEMAEALLPQVPAAFLFSCIDSFIKNRVRNDSFADKIVCFIAAYTLQAIIAVSNSIGTFTWMDALNACIKIVTSIWLVTGIIYCILNCIKGNEDIGSITNDVASIAMSVVYALFKEAMKIIFTTALFSIALGFVGKILGIELTGYFGIVGSVLIICFYIMLSRVIDKAGDFLSDKFVVLVSKGADAEYRSFFMGEIFCFVVSLIWLGSAMRLCFMAK